MNYIGLALILVGMENNNEESTLKIIKEVKSELSEYRKPFESDWNKYDNAYYGKQHKTGDDVKTTKNHIFKLVETEIPMLTDGMAIPTFTAKRQDKQAPADILAAATKYVYQDQNLMLLLPSLLRSSAMSAPGYLYVLNNPDAECGNGKIEYRQLPWKSVFLDGNAQTIEQSEKCRIEIGMRKDAIIRTWPEHAEKIKELTGTTKKDSHDDGNYEKRDVAGENHTSGKPKAYSSKDILTYVETWVKDYSLTDIDEDETNEEIREVLNAIENGNSPEASKWENHDAIINAVKQKRAELLSSVGLNGDASFEQVSDHIESILQQNPEAEELKSGLLIVKIIDEHVEAREAFKKLNPTSQMPKFEDGWRLIKSVGNVILYDGESNQKSGEIPLVPFYTYKDDTVYGFGIVKNIFNAQQTLNDVDFREFEGLRVCSNPGWVADHESEVDDNTLTNKPGIVVKKNKGTEVRRLEPGMVSPQLDARKKFDQLAMESIEGVNEQTMNGAAPVGSASGVAVQKIQTQPIGRIRLKGRNLEYYSMRRLSIITAGLILDNWTEEKLLRFRNGEGDVEEIYFNPIEMEELEYTVDISPTSMAGVDKDQLIAFYMMLLNNQHIDFEMFLSATPEFVGKNILVKTLKEKTNKDQAIQQAQEQYESQLQELQKQNIKLKGVIDSGRMAMNETLSADEKKIFKQQEREAAMSAIMTNELNNEEPITANQNNQELV
jgi:hypothetical protein